MLYIQQILYIFIGIFSSRYLLEFLGVDNYGLYGLVGSLVASLAALKIIFTSSVQRFINIEKNRSSNERIRQIFSYGIVLHVVLAIIFTIAAECIGLFGIPKLNLVANQQNIAFWLLQFSIISSFFDIIAIPYDALIIANERIYIFSIISILSHGLKFGGIFLIPILPFNGVLTYAVIILILSILARFASSTYCSRNFKETSKFIWKWDKTLFKEMCLFSGWNFFGNVSYSLVQEGLNVILNIFGGVILNAARSLAFQFRGILSSAISQMFVAFRPRIMSSYGSGDLETFTRLTVLSARISLFLCITIGSMFLFFGHEILHIWLTVIPSYTYSFICLIVVYVCIRTIHDPIDTAFKSYGDIKTYQLVECLNSLLTLPIAYVFLYLGYAYYFVFIALLITECINLVAILVLAHKKFDFQSASYVKQIILPTLFSAAILSLSYCLYKLLIPYNNNNIITLLCQMGIMLICIATINIIILFRKRDLKLILSSFKFTSKLKCFQ